MIAAVMHGVTPSRAALALIAAGHTDAAADVLLTCTRTGASAVTLIRDGRELRIRVGAA